ncbi:MAG: hypothetical protein M3Q23_09275 [Actinomycetota bacterium]|nr:hypothetical protein [Actinomycetota bacterium]
MRRWFGIGVALLLILAGAGIGIGAYHAGYNHGLVDSGHVREVVVGPGYGYGFHFGFLFFPLFFIGLFLLLRGAFWRHRWAYGGGPGHHMGPGPWGKGPGGSGGPGTFEDWHRSQHGESGQDPPGSPPQPVSSA